jgi:hypothetical protein
MRRFGKAIGSVAAGYTKERDGDERRDAQRCMLSVMAENPDADDKEIARIARTRLAKEHSKDDPRLRFVTPDAVSRLRRALAVAALERAKSRR